MNDKSRERQTLHALAMKESLDKVMNMAGGMYFGTDRLVEMSALSLISMLAPNGIRFCFIDDEQRPALEPGVLERQLPTKDLALIYKLGKGISVKIGDDGVWLMFETESGMSAMLHVESTLVGRGGGVIDKALKQWTVERIVDREELLPITEGNA